MGPLPILVVVLYLVTVTVVGTRLSRRSSDAGSWAVGGGQMGLLVIAAGVAGTRIGGVGTYGVAGDVMQTGLWNLWYGVNTFLALALVGVFFAVPFRRLGLRTVAETFQQRFGSRRSQVLTSLCVQTEYLIINILEPFVIGSILSTILGIPFGVAVFLGAGVLILYTSLGGLWGSAITNVIHCGVIVVGLSIVGMVGMNALGGWEGMREGVEVALATADPARDSASWWSLMGAGWGAVLAMFFSATIHTPAASVYVNFSSAARRERDVVPAFLLGGAIAALMPLLAGWIGAQTLATYGADSGLRSYQAITRLAVDLSPWLGGIAVAAILAAVISSGGPILLASSTMLVQDWLPAGRNLSSAAQLRAYRVTTVLYGLLAAFIAWRAEIGSILDLLLLGFAMVVPPAIALAYVLYWRRTTEAGCFWGIASGYLLGLVWYGLIRWAAWSGWQLPDDPGTGARWFHTCFVAGGEGIDPSYPTTLVPLAVVPIVSLLTSRAAASEVDLSRSRAFYRRLAGSAGE